MAIKITYWITTAIVALMMCYSGYGYLSNPEMAAGFHHLGYPDYFRVELAIGKFIGAVVLLVPLPGRIKEWAYAGFTIVFISAFIAHTVSGDPVSYRTAPLIFLVILAVSYISLHKMDSRPARA